MVERNKDPKWKEVSPGLWERENTPKSVEVDDATASVYKEAAREQHEYLYKLVERLLASKT